MFLDFFQIASYEHLLLRPYGRGCLAVVRAREPGSSRKNRRKKGYGFDSTLSSKEVVPHPSNNFTGECWFSRNKKSNVHIPGSQSRKWASRQDFRQHFWYYGFSLLGPGLKSKTVYIVRRCASIWRGPGFLLIWYLWRKGKFEICFLPVGFHKIRRATGFWSRSTKSSVIYGYK